MKISDEPVKKFLELQKQLPELLKSNGIKQVYVYKGIDMPKPTWERKRRTQTFSIPEMQDICDLINTGKTKIGKKR